MGCSFFVLTGMTFLRHLGIENDEALFATAFYAADGDGVYSYRLGRHRLPLMLLSYLGTLKSWLYRPILSGFGPGVVSLRLPVLLAGAASLWLFYQLLERVAGHRAAAVGLALLAADTVYLLTSMFDWGPVALQHLLLVAGMLLVVHFWQRTAPPAGKKIIPHWRRASPPVTVRTELRNALLLAGAFFLFGLALWDKALAIWSLSGVAIATLIVFPRQLFARVTLFRLAVAIGGLSLGALPLLLYNIHSHGGTLSGNATYESDRLAQKGETLLDTFRGTGLFDFLTMPDWQTASPHAPAGWFDRTSASLANLAGHPHSDLFLYAFCVALLLAPFVRGTDLRAMLFCLIVLLVAWLQMALTTGTGGGLHHTILLWPLPEAIVAISFAAASRRLARLGPPLLVIVLMVVIGSDGLLLNEYYRTTVRNGGANVWTDAIFPLHTDLEEMSTRYIFCLDWGYLDTLRVLSRNRLPLRVASVPEEPSETERRTFSEWVAHPDDVFVAHTRAFEIYPGMSARLVRFAAAAGYRKESLQTISDSNGRPRFEIFRFVRS
jgi:hypothetical protein